MNGSIQTDIFDSPEGVNSNKLIFPSKGFCTIYKSKSKLNTRHFLSQSPVCRRCDSSFFPAVTVSSARFKIDQYQATMSENKFQFRY